MWFEWICVPNNDLMMSCVECVSCVDLFCVCPGKLYAFVKRRKVYTRVIFALSGAYNFQEDDCFLSGHVRITKGII